MTLIDRFLTDTYAVERSDSGKYVNGIYEPGPTVTLQVRGSLQPASPRELKIPEEGARLKQYWKFYTDDSMFPIGTKMLSMADVVKINGETYKVWSVDIWQGFGVDLPHYKTILYREPEQ